MRKHQLSVQPSVLLLILSFILLPLTARLQVTCSTLGQTPQTAFPVCGTSTFSQTNVPVCGGRQLPGPCTNGGIADVNPFYYRFTCYTAGTLGLTITPHQMSDDYDWQVFDITGRDPNDIYINASLFVVCNWSGNTGVTGTSASGTGLEQCAGTGFPTISSMPTLIAGHEYLLLVSNFSASQKGYDLKFSGGTAVITDPILPAVTSSKVNCAGTEVVVAFNKRMRCNSVAANGSDFTIQPAGTIVSAAGIGCSSSFDLDSVRLTLAAPLAPGNYTITMANGSDGNTVIDNCNTGVLTGSTTAFTLQAQSPLPMGTVVPPACTPASVVINFPEPINCSSIATNGSDFTITGPGAVTVTSVTSTCNNGTATAITVLVSAPIIVPGNYQVRINQGSDGNTLTGECNRSVAAGQTTGFVILPQTPLAMGSVTPPSCSPSEIIFNLAEKIFCSTIAADGSDFVISGPTGVAITGANASCDANGQASVIRIQLSAPLAVTGTYQVRIVNGTDGNTLIGDCSRAVPAGLTTNFDIPDAPFTPMGLIAAPGCSPSTLQLQLPAAIRCISVATDGSDFRLTGPAPVIITGASTDCDANGLTQTVELRLSTPVVIGGNYSVELVTGTDGNTLLNECYRATPAGAITGFAATDTVSAEFEISVIYDCLQNEATFRHDGAHGVTGWNWVVNGIAAGNQPAFVRSFSSESQNEIKLTVSNGVCQDTYTHQLVFNNKITAAFDLPDMACPEDKIEIINKSTGPVDNWSWNFGTIAAPSALQTPPVIVYPLTGADQLYTIILKVSNNNGCETAKADQIKILGSCLIGVPSAFTPNNDGKNDFFYPLNAFKAEQLNFRVYNRWGQLVFHSTEWTKKWDGSIQGIPQATGTYVWMLEYVHRDTKEKVFRKGTVTLIR